MDEQAAKQIADRIIISVFGRNNPLSLQGIFDKFAFDVRLPKQVTDSVTGQPTWVQSTTPEKFISLQSSDSKPEGYWRRPKRTFNNIDDVLGAWSQINEMTSERQLDSTNIVKSDNIYRSKNIYHSMDISDASEVLFSDGISGGSNHIIACQRSKNLVNCIRAEDSDNCSNSFSVIWSKNITNCLFVSDASDVQDSIFCSHISNARFCVANVQLEEAEYREVREMVIRWILTG